jgi:hypothetical protein
MVGSSKIGGIGGIGVMDNDIDEGALVIDVKYAPFSQKGGRRDQSRMQAADEKELSQLLHQVCNSKMLANLLV